MKLKFFVTVSLLSFQALIAEPTEQDHVRASQNPGYYKHVVLKGIVKQMIFLGPPHFLSVENGDWAEPRIILEVDEASLVPAANFPLHFQRRYEKGMTNYR